jgi:dolichyl-phosphate beta-glucosyltransferase
LVSLILPAYNEAATIESTIRRASEYFQAREIPYEIIVSADGTDGTREIASGLVPEIATLSVIGSPERRGKGLGIREAVALARGTIVGFADADDKTPIEEFDKFLPLLENYEVVIGSRADPRARIERPQPWYRRVGSRGFAIAMHAIAGLHDIKDTQCGFKFFKRAAARDLFTRQRIDGYMFDVEILYLAEKLGFRIAQVPVLWRDDGDSRLNLFRGNVRNAMDLLKIRLLHRVSRSSVAADSPAELIQDKTLIGRKET